MPRHRLEHWIIPIIMMIRLFLSYLAYYIMMRTSIVLWRLYFVPAKKWNFPRIDSRLPGICVTRINNTAWFSGCSKNTRTHSARLDWARTDTILRYYLNRLEQCRLLLKILWKYVCFSFKVLNTHFSDDETINSRMKPSNAYSKQISKMLKTHWNATT